MRNLAEQGRVFWSILYFIISWTVFILLFAVLFLSAVFPRAKVLGYRLYNYTEETSGSLKSGSLMIIKAFDPATNPMEEGQIFCFVTEAETISPFTGLKKKEITYHTRIFLSATLSPDRRYFTVLSKDLNGGDFRSDELTARDIFGNYFYAVPYVGLVSDILTRGEAVTFSVLFLLAVILLLLPIFVVARTIRHRYRVSPFPEGLDTSRMNKEDLYIYRELKRFFRQGRLSIRKGFDCDKVFIDNKMYFANIAYINKSVYVNINKDFYRFDNRIDRSGAIRVAVAHDLENAKERIMAIYQNYFKSARKRTPF